MNTDYPRVRLELGRDGQVIGRTIEGLVVLFSNPPAINEQEVYLIEYQRRTSKNNKEYIKAFTYVSKKHFELQKLSSVADYLSLSTEEVERLVKLKSLGEEVIANTLLRLTNSDAVLVDYNRYMLLPSKKVIRISDDIEISEDKPFLPNKIYSDKFALISIDDCFETFEAQEISAALSKRDIASFYYEAGSGSLVDLIVIIPKSEAQKYITLKKSQIPRYFKKRIYIQLLGIAENEVVLNDRQI